MSLRLFFYGILRADVAEWDFLAGIGSGVPAKARGLLHAIPTPDGWYPALTRGEGEVHGLVHEAGSLDLVPLDRFEGYDPERPDESEYLRRSIVVTTGSGALEADAYLWNRPVDGALVAIPHGDFARWLAETGNAPLSHR